MPVSLEAVAGEPQDGPPDEGALEAQEEIEDEAPQATEPPEVDTPVTEIPEELLQEPVTPAPKRRGRPPKAQVQEPMTPAPKRRGRPPKAQVQEPVTPAPKRRGRPPKAQAQAPVAKAKPVAKRVPKRLPPPPPSDSETDSSPDSPTASLHRDDIETMMLSYLVQRKNQQMDKRRQMWTRLAGLS